MQSLWKTVWKFLQIIKIWLPYNLAVFLLDIYLEKMKTLIQKDTWTPMFTAALFTIAKAWEKLKSPSTDEWINKMEGVCVCVCVCVQ